MLENTGLKTNKIQTIQKKTQPRKSKQRKTKLHWYSHFLRHLARKRDGLILQQSRAHTASQGCSK